jgi:hypothetical protein
MPETRRQKNTYYLTDTKGLRLYVRPNGSKLWMLRFMQQKPDGSRSESTAGLGAYPHTILEQARRKAAAHARRQPKGFTPLRRVTCV